MTDPNIFTVKLSQEEILLITLRLRQPVMFGIDERLLKLSPEEAQKVMEAAELSLLQRDFLRRDEDGNMHLAPLLIAIIVTCAAPEKTFLVTRALPGEPSYTLMVHKSEEMFVNHSIEADSRHAFTVLPDAMFMLEGLVSFAQADDYARPDCPETAFPEQVFKLAKELSAEGSDEEVISGLANYMTIQTAQAFCLTLKEHQATVSIMRTLHAEKPEDTQNDSFSLLQGGGWQWIMRTFDGITGKMITLAPISAAEMRLEIEKMVS